MKHTILMNVNLNKEYEIILELVNFNRIFISLK